MRGVQPHRSGNPLSDTVSCVIWGKLLNLSVPHFLVCIVDIITLILTSQGFVRLKGDGALKAVCGQLSGEQGHGQHLEPRSERGPPAAAAGQRNAA